MLHAKRHRTTIERDYKITVSILNGFLIFSIIQAFIFAGLFWVMPVDKVAGQILKALKSKKKVAYVTKRWRLVTGILKRIHRIIYDKM